jgi:malyl-CoA/(S)-citramalyl-CoA lyase
MKTTRVGGGHPDYLVRTDPDPANPGAPRPTAQQDLWHYTMAKMVDACASVGALPFYGPFGDIADLVACEDQFRNAYLMGCVGTWTLHPNQIAIAKRVFSPKPEEVTWAKRVIEAMPDGSGAVMIDGKMQDDATWKQCKVVLNLAQLIAERDAEYKALYGL